MKNFYFCLLAILFAGSALRAQIISVDAGSNGGNYTITNYPGNFTSYYDGFSVVFRANHMTPGAATMNIAGLGAKNIVNTAGSPLVSGDIQANQVVTIVYYATGNNFQMITTSGNISSGGSISGGTAGRLAVYTSSTAIGNSSIYESATNIGVGTAPTGSYKLEVNGKVGSLGINETSDLRYKKNILPIDNALLKVTKLRGVTYDWRVTEFKEKNFTAAPQIGLIAQEVEKVVPQVVGTDADGFKSVEYSKLVALLIEAIKEQDKKITSLQTAVAELQNQNSQLKAEKENVSLKTGKQ